MAEDIESDSNSDLNVDYDANSNNETSISIPGEETRVRKIEIDSTLKFSKTMKDVKTEIRPKVRIYDTFDEKLSCNVPAFPTDYALVKLASVAYNNYEKQQDLPSGWEFLTAAWNCDMNNGYYGCAYFNAEHQQIVIAHRGTVKSRPNDWYTDGKGVYKAQFVAQMNSATTFTDMVLSLISEVNKDGAYLKLSLTGHSLGGWLAQVTTFTAKYLTKDERKSQFLLIGETQIGYHAHTVVFESPGCKQMLEKLRTVYIKYRYGDINSSQISIDSLDITTYLSAPNRINCCNAHVGKLYRIFVNLLDNNSKENENSWRMTKWALSAAKFVVNRVRRRFFYTIDTHNIDKIVECFDPQTGLVKRDIEGRLEVQEVLNWPIIKGIVSPGIEYDEVIKWLSRFENYYPSVDETFNERHEIRYHTDDVDENSFKFHVFSEGEHNLVEGYDIRRFFPKYESVIFSVDTDDSKNVLNSAIQNLDSMKFQIDRDKHVPLLGPNVKPSEFVSYVKQLNHYFPYLNRVSQTTKSFTIELVTAIYKTESDEYLSSIRDNSLEFDVGAFNLNQFLIKEKPQVLLQVENRTAAGSLKIYKIFESVKVKTKYDNGNSMFLDMKRILRIKQLSFASVIEQIREDCLIVIENNENSEEAVDVLIQVIQKANENQKIKIILIVDMENDTNWTEIVGEHEISHHEGIQLSDLSSDTRTLILERELINLQGHHVSLAQIIPELNKLKSVKDLIKIAVDSNQELDVCRDFLGNSRFDVFAVSNVTVDEFQTVIPPGERVALFKNLNPSKLVRFVILDNDKANDQFENICWHFSHVFRIHWLNLEENQLILKDYRERCDGDNDKFIPNLFSEILQIQVRKVLSGCYIIIDGTECVSVSGEHKLQSIISTDVLKKLGAKEEIKAGSELADLGEIKDYYIGRTLSKQEKHLPLRTLKNSKDIFAIGNIEVDTLIEISGCSIVQYQQWLKIKDEKIQFIVLDVKDAENQFKDICEFHRSKNNIHWLIRTKYGSDFIYKHMQSCLLSSVTDVLDWVFYEDQYNEEAEVQANDKILPTEHIADSIVTVVGLPGMGKSTFFTHLALRKKQLHPFLWIVKIKLTDVPWKCFPKVEQHVNNNSMIESLAELLKLESEFEKSLFEYCLHDEKVVLILDAFDEVSPKYDHQIFGLLETLQTEMKVKQLWVSSRPYALKDEQTMGTVFTLQGFDEAERKNFCLSFWRQKISLDIDIYKCLYFAKNVLAVMPLDNTGKSMAGIPMISKVIAEYYQDDFVKYHESEGVLQKIKESQQINIHTFYEKVIEKKTGLIFAEKFGLETEQQSVYFEIKKRHKTTVSEHKLIGLVSCQLDSLAADRSIAINDLINSINKGEEVTGLISSVVNGVPQFIHATFAEYFAALWLIEQMIARNEKDRFVKLFEGLCDLLKRDSHVVLSLFNSKLHDLKEKLTECLKENKHLVENLSKVSIHYLDIFRFLITLGVQSETLYKRSDEQR